MAQAPILTLSKIGLNLGQSALFEDLDAVLHTGDRVALVGRNGSGKSTLMKVIAGHLECDRGERYLQQGMAVAYLDQNPDFSAFETLRDYAISKLGYQDAYKVDVMASGLKLNLEQKSQVASGGELRRASLIATLSQDAELMLLDEPTNHLDIEAVAWLEDYLQSSRKAYVLISHDRAFLRNLTRKTMWLDRGRVLQNSKGFAAFETWRDKIYEEEDLQRHKQARLIKAEARWAVEGISARRKRNQGRLRRLSDLKDDRAAYTKRKGAPDLALANAEISGKKVIEARRISFSHGDIKIVENLDLKIQRGDRLALIGPNGVGKTSLISLLLGELAPDQGTIKHGTKLVPVYFDQRREGLITDTTLWESLVNDPQLGVVGKSDHVMVRGTPRHVIGYLKDFLFEEAQARGPISKLSGGERARLLLAKLMAKESNLLVLDEPTNDLDVETLELFQDLLTDYSGTVILVSHDREFIDSVATQSLLLTGAGRHTLYAGGWSDILAQKGAAVFEALKPREKKKPSTRVKEDPKSQREALSFTQKDRLKKIPQEIDQLTAEIKKLEAFLSDASLFSEAPKKFEKASLGLQERQKLLEAKEEEWLELLEKSEGG